MEDLTIIRSGEFMLAEVRANTDAGEAFVDAWQPARPGAEYQVVDSGRIIVSTEDQPGLVAAAQAAGLATEEVAHA